VVDCGTGTVTVGVTCTANTVNGGAGTCEIADGGTNDVFNDCSGPSTIFVSPHQGAYDLGTGDTFLIADTGRASISLGGAAATVFAGAANLTIDDDSGALLFVGGTGAATITRGSPISTPPEGDLRGDRPLRTDLCQGGARRAKRYTPGVNLRDFGSEEGRFV
jgi:hypothetical protein